MVGRPGKYQPRFTAGELDALIQANTDEAIYFKGASAFSNVKPLPQGGFTNAWGTVAVDVARNVLISVSVSSVAAPSGGTAANVLNGTLAAYLTTNTIAVGSAVVLTADLGSLTAVSCIDLESFDANLPGGAFPTIAEPSPPLSPAVSGTIAVATSPDNSTWTPLENTRQLGDALRTRRFAAPAGSPRSFRYLQVTVTVATTGGLVFNLGNLRVFVETSAPSPMRIRSFTHSRSLAYDVVFTDQNIEIYSASGRVASAPTTITGASLTGALIPAMKNAQQLDTMLIVHQQVPPLRLYREGADNEWDLNLAPFVHVPNYDYGAGYSNGVAAQWQISFFGFDSSTNTNFPLPTGGVHYNIAVNGVKTVALQQPAGSYTGTAAAIQAAILALPGVGAGVTVSLTSGGAGGTPPVFTITFGGAANAGNGWAVSGTPIDKGDAAITAANIVTGVIGGEPIMSAARGWPGAVCFYQQRTILAGFAGVPNAFLASETGNYYELNTQLTASSAPMLIPLDADGAATIVDVHAGRTLDFFTDAGEYWLAGGALDATTTPVIVRATTNGISPTVDAFENEGKTIYAAKAGGTLFEFVFNYSEQNYDSNNISVQSSSVVQNVIDGAMRRLTGSTDVNELYCVRADGQAFMLNLLRQQDIVSFARRVTDGSFLCVNVNDRFEVTFGVSRLVNGQSVQFIERATEGVYLDAQQSVSVTAGQSVVSGLSTLAGATTVYAIVDNYPQGPFTVSAGGALTLGFAAQANGSALIGRWTPPNVATLPQPRDVAPRTVVRRPCRVHTVRATVVATSNIAIGANGDGPYNVDLLPWGSPTDTPFLISPYTGPIVAEGLQGFTEDGIVTLTQLLPGPMSVTGVTVEVDL